MSEEIGTAVIGGMTIESSSQSSDDLKKNIQDADEQKELTKLSPEEREAKEKAKEKDDVSEAASELGKKGGKAAAKKRAEAKKAEAKAEEKPEAQEQPEEVEEEPPEAKAEDAEPEEAERPKKGPRHDPIARMKEATRKEAEAKRALAEEQRTRQELETRIAALERGEKPQERETQEYKPPSPPDPKEFTDLQEYLDARDQYTRHQVMQDVQGMYAQIQQQARFDSEADAFRKEFEKAGIDKDTFLSIPEEIRDVRIDFDIDGSQPVDGRTFIGNELFLSRENAPALMLYFKEHPDDFQRIAALQTPREVSREMAKLETRLEAATAGNGSRRKETVSKAPPPITPVKGKPSIAEDSDPQPKPGESVSAWARRTGRPLQR